KLTGVGAYPPAPRAQEGDGSSTRGGRSILGRRERLASVAQTEERLLVRPRRLSGHDRPLAPRLVHPIESRVPLDQATAGRQRQELPRERRLAVASGWREQSLVGCRGGFEVSQVLEGSREVPKHRGAFLGARRVQGFGGRQSGLERSDDSIPSARRNLD